jgi:hypothetical protein
VSIKKSYIWKKIRVTRMLIIPQIKAMNHQYTTWIGGSAFSEKTSGRRMMKHTSVETQTTNICEQNTKNLLMAVRKAVRMGLVANNFKASKAESQKFFP